MKKDKAYKVLAEQEGISNKKAKELIDRGLVYSGNRKIVIARGEIDVKTTLRVEQLQAVEPIFEDENIIVVNKPAFVNSDEVEMQFKKARLLHRLDKETSGVLMLVKNEEFRHKAIKAFKKLEVYKEYTAWVEGVVSEPFTINLPIETSKGKRGAISRISELGKPAITHVEPLLFVNKKSKVKLVIEHGRTHQIRVHLAHHNHAIHGDMTYGGKNAKRLMLHARKVEILGYTFEAPEPKIFKHYEHS
jgi:23S rRNA pseudouridine1911/1915/1917 synthase